MEHIGGAAVVFKFGFLRFRSLGWTPRCNRFVVSSEIANGLVGWRVPSSFLTNPAQHSQHSQSTLTQRTRIRESYGYP